MELKDTLNLLRTQFPMRAGLPNKEPKRQQQWDDEGIYKKRQVLNEGKPTFILHDGPPYANGSIHMGHALNKISKDIIVRYKSMSGFRAPYVPGWDTHGLPIEQALVNKGVDRHAMSVSEFRQLCEKYALEQVDIQRAAFKRLGVSGDWDNPYITLQPEYEAAQLRVFGKMAEKGYIYRGMKPIYWSPSSESALAEAEIEYKDVRSASIYVAFPVKDGKGKLADDVSFVIWTTTPWTIPSNLAITVKPGGVYAVIEADGRKFVVAKEMIEKVQEAIGWHDVRILDTLLAEEMEYMTALHPFYDRESLLILGDHVTFDDGTGLVHTAPGHGADDYVVGQRYGLEALSPIDDKGFFTDEAPGFEGMFYDDANKKVTELLDEKNALLKLEFFTHSYPHDWRSKKPVIFRATPQWFASIKDFRQEILDVIPQVDWLQPWGEQRIHNMIRDRGDWVISRQRQWGVPLPIFYAENGEAIIDPVVTEHIAQLVEQYGSNVWFERDAKDLLPEGFTHPGSPNGLFEKETDIMDVWFDSGSSHAGVLGIRKELSFPADLYLEGSDQYRGWFNSSLTTSVAVHGVAPYRAVLSQGFVLDDNGRAMSKSLGNVIDPMKVMDQLGADIIRLWVTSVDAGADVPISMGILQQVSETYRKIRNTFRFMIQNTSDFDVKEDAIAYDALRSADQYILNRLDEVVANLHEAYESYDFRIIYREINHFCTVDLSNFYMNIAKDILYIEAPDAYNRRAIQTVFYQVLVTLAKLLTPVIPHTAEEVWEYLQEPEEFVQLTELPRVKNYENKDEILARWTRFMDVRDNILKVNEVSRENKVIGKDFEARTTLYVSDEIGQLLEDLQADIRQIMVASALDIVPLAEKPAHDEHIVDFDGLSVKVEHMPGEVCDRCRITSEDTQMFGEDRLCGRCQEIIKTHYPEYFADK
ncbi:isoleucine--tRNA ligase [Allofustis seminis]|uniref:isoleucine--tRNA ligase n=1 Tax=Allofustis seminis TaxID=166939 RepID=UPI0003652C53|nr:isoleucine--tRNA ligase [Allofustis seminis]